MLSFLYRTFRVAMVAVGGEVGENPRETPGEKWLGHSGWHAISSPRLFRCKRGVVGDFLMVKVGGLVGMSLKMSAQILRLAAVSPMPVESIG